MKIQVSVTEDELDEMNLSMDSLEESIIIRLDNPIEGSEYVAFDMEMINRSE